MQALDRADQDRNRELLRDVKPQELYEAGLTVMMRLVFLLAAEERGLLLLGEPRYDSFYAVSTLRMQLRAESRRDPRAAARGVVAAARRVPRRLRRHRPPDAAPARDGRLALRSRPLPVPRRTAEGHVLAPAPRRAAADRRPHGAAAARSHPDLRGAHALVPRARRRADRPRLRGPARTHRRARRGRDAGARSGRAGQGRARHARRAGVGAPRRQGQRHEPARRALEALGVGHRERAGRRRSSPSRARACSRRVAAT